MSEERSVTAERCGAVISIDKHRSNEREACCWLPVLDGTDRCKWHADCEKDDVAFRSLDAGDEVFLNQAILKGADLSGQAFLAERELIRSDFSNADLRGVDLSRADLCEATFEGADLHNADLSGADLRNADFTGAKLVDANLADADAREATFERADLEKASLVRTNLRDASVEDAELYEVLFSDTWINEGTDLGWQCIYETDRDIDFDRDGYEIDRLEAAAWTYRAFEVLCRENALPSRTRWYYIREKEARRKQAWEAKRYAEALKSEMSRWVMEYGSNPWRIVAVSLLVILGWAFLYPLTGGLLDTATDKVFGYAVETPTEAPRYYMTTVFLKSLYFSVVTFATLGYGDIQPVGATARALATIETLLGSLLVALLVFVLSRIVTW